jgi:hypothetical protein
MARVVACLTLGCMHDVDVNNSYPAVTAPVPSGSNGSSGKSSESTRISGFPRPNRRLSRAKPLDVSEEEYVISAY